MQPQSHGGGETSKPCSNNDYIELEWLEHLVDFAVTVVRFMRPIFPMGVLQEIQAVGGIGWLLLRCQRSHLGAAFNSRMYLNGRSACTFTSRLRHVYHSDSGVCADAHLSGLRGVDITSGLLIGIKMFASLLATVQRSWLIDRVAPVDIGTPRLTTLPLEGINGSLHSVCATRQWLFQQLPSYTRTRFRNLGFGRSALHRAGHGVDSVVSSL